MTIDLLFDAKADLAHSPVWDGKRALLLFTDIMHGRVHELDPATGAARVFDVGEPVGVAVPSRRNDWILATKTGFHRLDPATGDTARIASVEIDQPDNRMSDGRVDPRGRFWAASLSLSGRQHGALYRLDANGRVLRMLTGLTLANGLAWSPEGTLLYFVDTATGRIDLFDFDEAWGTITNRRTFAVVPPAAGYPSGLTVDAAGFVWVTLWGGGALHRYTPDGQVDRVVPLPVTHPTHCVFGGRGLDELFVTSARIDRPGGEPGATNGGVYRLRPGVKGQASKVFGG